MKDRFFAKLAIGLAIVLMVFSFRVAVAFYRSPRISSKAKLLTTIGRVEGLSEGGVPLLVANLAFRLGEVRNSSVARVKYASQDEPEWALRTQG